MSTDTPTGIRRRSNGDLAKEVKIGLDGADTQRLAEVHQKVEDELGRPVSRTQVYSVALRMLHHRLTTEGRNKDVSLFLFR
jgi:hypothetical protein